MSESFNAYHRWLGIPVDEQPPNHYRLLGTTLFEDDADVIEAAADRQMTHLRTYQAGTHGELSQKLLNEVSAARICLLSPTKKAAYDATLRLETAPADPPVQVRAQPLARRKSPAVLLGVVAGTIVALLVAGYLWGPRFTSKPKPDDQIALQDEPKPEPPEPVTPGGSNQTPETEPVVEPVPVIVHQPDEPPEPITNPNPVTPVVEPEPAEPEPVGSEIDESARLAVPSEAERHEATEQLNDAYDFLAASTPEEQLELAGQLRDLADESRDNPTERYVLLRKMMELATTGGDAPLLLETLDLVGQDFEIDVLHEKQVALEQFAQDSTGAARVGSLVDSSLLVTNQALREGRCDVASAVIDAAYHACSGAAGKEYRKQVYDRRREVQAEYKAWQDFQDALTALESDPTDAEANLTVGQWYCFHRHDFLQGLPCLAKGSDESLKILAEQELSSPPTEADKQVDLADSWWDLGQAAKGETKDALLLHAGVWYERAQSSITGLSKQKVAKRLEEIQPLMDTRGAAGLSTSGPIAVRTLNPDNVQLLGTLRGHTDALQFITFSADGSTLVSVANDKTVRRWDIAKQESSGVLPLDTGMKKALSPNGSGLAIGGSSKSVSLVSFSKGQVGVLPTAGSSLRKLLFSPDGSQLAVVDYSGKVTLWNMDTLRSRGTISTGLSSIYYAAFSQNGAILAAKNHSGAVGLWNTTTGIPLGQLGEFDERASVLVFSPDGKTLALAGGTTGIRLWSLSTGKLQETLASGSLPVRCLAYSPDGSLLASGDYDNSIKLWDPTTGQLKATLTVPGRPVCALTFSHDGSMLAAGGDDYALHIWNSTPIQPSEATDASDPPRGAFPPRIRPEAPDSSVDLLKRIDLSDPDATGDWQFQGETLVTANTRFAKLPILHTPTEQYRLTMVAERKSGGTAFSVGLVVGGNRTIVVLDDIRNNSGLSLVRGRSIDGNETRRTGVNLETNQAATIVCTVSESGLLVVVDGETVVDWRGDPRELSVDSNCQIANPKCLYLVSGGSVFSITKLEYQSLEME